MQKKYKKNKSETNETGYLQEVDGNWVKRMGSEKRVEGMRGRGILL